MASIVLYAICVTVIVATISFETKAQTVTCPEGFETHNQQCYKFVFINGTWIQALTFCQAMGSRLLSIEDHNEQNYVTGLMASLNVNSFAKPNRYWIGGSDLAEYRTFRWTFSESQITYSHWAKFEPFSRDGIERCMEMYSDHDWNDFDCNGHRNFICETSAS